MKTINMSKSKSSGKDETEEGKTLGLGNGESLVNAEKEKDVEKVIEITVNSIENLSNMKTMSKDCSGILIRVEHNEITLGISRTIKLSGNDEVELSDVVSIGYAVLFPISLKELSDAGSAVSTPILISALESHAKDEDEPASPVGSGSAGEIGGTKNKARMRTSVFRPRSSKGNENQVTLGICNLDLMPLMLGEKTMSEKLLLEVPTSRNVGDGVNLNWENLALLTVSAKLLCTEIFEPDMNVNFLNITVESIYNLLPSWTDDMDYKANTVIYVENQVPKNVVFDGGARTGVPDIEKTKCWQSLAHLEGRAKFSKYKLSNTVTKNSLKNDIDIELSANAPRIQWNSMRRSLILQSGCEAMTSAIKGHKYWPFFFTINGKAKDNAKQKAKDTNTALRFQCYADISELLFPGTTRTRTVAQLQTFSATAMSEQTGLDKSVFEKEISQEPPTKEKESKKGKSSTKGSTATVPAAVSTEIANTPSFPLVSENGDPVFVIIEFELHRPLQAARTLEDLTDCIDKMVHPYVLPPNPYGSDLAQKHYSNCVKKLVDVLAEGYRDYIENCSTPDVTYERRPHKLSPTNTTFARSEVSSDDQNVCNDTETSNDQKECKYDYIKDEIECFIQHLHETGLYLSVRTTLKNKITMLLDQKFQIDMHTLSQKECQNFVSTTYVYLVEEMHRALNETVEGRYAEGSVVTNPGVSSPSYFAEESCALGYVEKAKKEYLEMITKDNKNPDTWIEYATYLIRFKDMDRAIECCREAVALDSKHKIALLLYGLILCQKQQYRDAEIFLQTATRVHPRFTEAWAILHLFYLRTQYFVGADVALEVAKKCITDKSQDGVAMEFLNREPLLWAKLNYPKDRIYLVAAVLLIRLSCYDFAEIALAQELSEKGRTMYFLYYVAVQHFMEERHEDALSHLEEAANIHGMDYSIASLMGHCHLEEGNIDRAIYCYEFANSSFNRPEDLHLTQLRLAHLYLRTDRYDTAKKIFLVVCKNSPTCRSWLGVGISCYHLNDMKNAEKSLTEANSLDSSNAEVWGYLCLTNMSLQRYDEFLHCYQQVVKNNLTNTQIWTMIEDLMENLGYVAPVLSINCGENTTLESFETEGEKKGDEETEENL